MYKRAGKEIKTLAKVLVILGMIPVVIGAAIGAFLLIDEVGLNPVISILVAIVAILISYVILRLCNLILYSWGEVVDRVTRIDEKLEKMMDRPAPAAPAASPYAAPSHSYAPSGAAPAAPVAAPVKPAPVAPVTPVTVKTTPVVSTPIQSAPTATAAFNSDSGMEDEYTQAAVSRPVPAKYSAAPAADSSPKPIYSAPVRPVAANWTCPACGQVNNADGSWCRNCGTKRST